jgi:Protein of unknown function (DUF1566)
MKSRLFSGVLGAGFLLIASITTAHAALIGVLPVTPNGTDYQAYYDDVANLTWLANANAAGTTMNWADANAWAAGLDVNGVTGWRLPDTLQPDSTCSINSGGNSSGYNCTGSEMGNLFYNVLGGTAGQSITTSHNSNYGLFSNVQSGTYWSATEFAPNSGIAWYFAFGNGNQGISYNTDNFYAWAVQSGNAAVVPVPAAAWLFGSGLLGLIGVAKRRPA